ncbi:MAG: ATP-binding protein [Sumerlaeia bacterium]
MMKIESDESLQEFSRNALDQYPTSSLQIEGRRQAGKRGNYPSLKTLRGGLRRRVFLILLGFALIPAAVILFLSYLSAAETLQGRLRQESIDSTRRVSLEIDRRLSDYGKILEGAKTQFQPEGDSVQVNTPLFEGVMELPPALEKSIFLFPEGTVFFKHSEKGRLTSEVYGLVWQMNGLPFDVSVLERVLRESSSQLSQAVKSTSTGNHVTAETATKIHLLEFPEQTLNGPCIVMSIPLLQKKGESEFLGVCMPIKELLEATHKQLGPAAQGGFVYSARQGIIFESSSLTFLPTIWETIKLRISQPNIEENEYFMVESDANRLAVASRPIRTSGMFTDNTPLYLQWHVIEIVDLQDTFVALTKLFWTLVLLGLALMMVTLLAAVLLSARLVQPIRDLTNGMRRYAQGDLDYRVEVHTQDELENLADAANIMAESLRNSYQDLASRMLELDEKANQLSLIHSISRSINQSLDLDQLFQQIVKELTGIIHCERISMALYDKDSNHLTLDFVYPVERDVLPQHTLIPMDSSLMGKAIRDSTITLKSTKSPGTYFEENHLYRIGIRKVCIVPLMATNGPVGTLNLGAVRKDAFDIRELKLMERVAEPLGLALEHGRLYKQVASFAQKLEETVEKRTSELKSAQEKLVQAERFAATGSIAAHIGHEINNPLSIIKNYIKIMNGKALKLNLNQEAASGMREGLQIIEEEIDRIARIVSQLRQVSKPPESKAQRFFLRDEIAKLEELFKSFVEKHSIQIDSIIDPKLGEVVCSADYLRQIIINLIRNSIDALDGKTDGKIRIHAALSKSMPGFFYVTIEDNGSGISPENLNSIFDPFFTTKTEGKGTGLGLSVSYGLAQSMGGMMRAKSEKGKGTTIRLELPIIPNQDDDEFPRKHSASKTDISSFTTPKRKRNIIIG